MIELLTIVNRILSFAAVMLSAIVWNWTAQRKQMRGPAFFGVRVESGFAESEAGLAILKTFRLRVWSWTFGFACLTLLIRNPALGTAAGSMAAYCASLGAFALAHRQTRRQATLAPEPSVRAALLVDEPDSHWLNALDWLSMIVPLTAPTATLIFLQLHRGQLPHDTLGPARLIPVIFALSLGVMCSANQFALRFRARAGDWAPSPGASHKYRTYLGMLQSWVFTFITAQLCVLVLMPFHEVVPWMRNWNTFTYFAISFPAQGLWLLTLWRLRFWLNRHLATESVDPMPDACWKWGYFYFNRSDPALVVPLRAGVGQSFNYARSSVWAVSAVVVVLTVASLIQTATIMARITIRH